jgi:hypothetical protein
MSSGSDRLEAAVVVTASDQLADDDRAVLADLAVATVLSAAPDGTLRQQ